MPSIRKEFFLVVLWDLAFTILWVNSFDDRLMIIFRFTQKTGFDISCKLSLLEIVCMNCQNLFSKKNKKTILVCCLLKILPRVLGPFNKIVFQLHQSEKLSHPDLHCFLKISGRVR